MWKILLAAAPIVLAIIFIIALIGIAIQMYRNTKQERRLGVISVQGAVPAV